MILDIINELNLENGSNYKMDILRKHKDNELFKRVLKMTYDNVKYTYGVSQQTLKKMDLTVTNCDMSLEEALNVLEKEFCTRNVTGNAAIEKLQSLFNCLSDEDTFIVKSILDRDLRINLGKTNINKVFKNLVTKPPYMRCSLPDKLDRIKYTAIVQQKADGTYRSLIIDNGDVTLMGRSGEQDEFPMFFDKVKNLPDGVYIGELMLRRFNKSEDRFKANGLINSDTEQEDMYMQCWDYLTLEEWNNKESKERYDMRLTALVNNILDIEVIEEIPSKVIESYEEAMEFYKEQIDNGFEGAVLKNLDTPFKDHTSPTQIKLKEEAVAEFRVTAFHEGTGRLEGTLGAMEYMSEDRRVQGKMGGFTDEDRKYIWGNKDEILGNIVSVKYNGVTKAKGKDTWSLMFANFVEFRPEKDTADTLEYIQNALK